MTTRNEIDPCTLSQSLGGAWHRHYGVAPCPVCQSERRTDQNALTINVKDDKLLLHCKKSGCEFRDILTAAGITPGHVEIDLMAMEQAEHNRREKAARLQARARSLWDYGEPITGTYGEQYLRARAITCALPDSLRWLSDTYHGRSGQWCSAMIADVQPIDGIHRTYFTKNGVRLTKSAKMMLGPCAGGAVRLSETVGPLVVTEGIETGLSLLSGILDGPHTVWAALSTSGMKSLILPEGPGQLIVATDSDDSGAGHEAGNVLARSAHTLGWGVSLLPAPDGQDWNNVLQSGVVA